MPKRYAGPFDVFLKAIHGGAEYISRHNDPDRAYKIAQEMANKWGRPAFVMDLWTMHTIREFLPSGPKDWIPKRKRR